MGSEGIRRLRLRLGWSQERLAREMGVSFSTINRWERGKSSPSPMAVRILRRLQEREGFVNKRSAPRMALRYPVIIERPGAKKGADALSSFTENISPGGLMFGAAGAFRAGDILRMCIGLGEQEPIRAVSEVRWVLENGEDKKVGVSFNGISPRDIIRVVNLMLEK